MSDISINVHVRANCRIEANTTLNCIYIGLEGEGSTFFAWDEGAMRRLSNAAKHIADNLAKEQLAKEAAERAGRGE